MTTHPRFSIIIPTYRRPEQLKRCLEGITRLDYPRTGFEVVVVSDERASAAEAIVREFQGLIRVRALGQEHGGPARARNTGAASSAGEFLLFLDDDCTPTSDWLSQWDAHNNLDLRCAAGGGTVNALPENPYSRASHALLEFIQAHFHTGQSHVPPFLASNNFCVPAERFRAINGFSTAFTIAAAEDRDFCDRWWARGWPMSRAHQAIVLHSHELTLPGFWQQHWNYGRGAFRLRQERSARGHPSRVEPFRFYFDLIRYGWKADCPGSALQLSTLLCLSQAANSAGFVTEWLRNYAHAH